MNTQTTAPLLRRTCAKLRRNGVPSQLARRAVASLAILIAAENLAEAGSSRTKRSIESVATRAAGEPIMAIVSLRSQRITIYDADGWILRAPVSSGQAGRETPAGIARFDADGANAVPAGLAPIGPPLRRAFSGRLPEGCARLNSAICRGPLSGCRPPMSVAG